ncbi:NAD(P)-binding protein [Aspergillus tetrazonus]
MPESPIVLQNCSALHFLGLILVTGVTGFTGSYIANGLLELGYRVRGTVRSSEKAAWVTQALTKRNPSAAFEAVIVPDQNTACVCDTVLKDVDGLAHVAGDVRLGPDPTKVITPSIEALRGLLEAASKEPSVKRFVLTSSDQAASNRSTTREIQINGETWNEEAIKAAWRPPPYGAERGWDIYFALKAQVEKEIWKFSQEKKPSFVVNSVLPTYTIGAIFDEQQAGSAAKWLLGFYKDPSKDGFMRGFGASYCANAGDVAVLHIGALTQALDTRQVNTESELDILRQLGKDGWASFEDSVLKVLESP